MCLIFGERNGSALFHCIRDAVRHMMHQCQFDVVTYIDDIFEIALSSRIDASFDALHQLLQRSRFPAVS